MMRNRLIVFALFGMAAAGFAGGLLVESRVERVQAQAGGAAAFPAVAGQKGGANPALLGGKPVYSAWK